MSTPLWILIMFYKTCKTLRQTLLTSPLNVILVCMSNVFWDSRLHRDETAWCCSFWFSHKAKPLFLEAFLWVLYFILGKVWEPPSVAPQVCSGQRGSVCVAWLVVALCKRTEILWAEPVIRVMDWVSKAGPADVTAGNSNTSSLSEGVKTEDYPELLCDLRPSLLWGHPVTSCIVNTEAAE